MAGDKDKPIEVIVTIDDNVLGDVESVADHLRRAGLEVTRILSSIGQIHGRTASKHLGKLRRVRGVLDAQVAGDMSIPPPDEDVQ